MPIPVSFTINCNKLALPFATRSQPNSMLPLSVYLMAFFTRLVRIEYNFSLSVLIKVSSVGKLFFKDTHLPSMFERGRCKLDIDVKTLMMVDSQEMTEADRDIIVHNCRRSKADKILITHGTDTMVKTATYLASQDVGGELSRSVVFDMGSGSATVKHVSDKLLL